MQYDDPSNPNRRIFRPDFSAAPQPQWQQFPEEEINMQPAASALKQKFMQRGNMGTGNTPMPTMNDLPEMDMPNMGGTGVGGEALKKGGVMKSL